VSYTIRAHLGPLPGQIEDALLSVPGARLFRGAWQVSWHALKPWMEVCGVYQLQPRLTAPDELIAPDTRHPWEVIRHRLLTTRDGLRESYADKWPTEYQRDALCYAGARPGALLHHPTGSGKTFTAIAWGCLTSNPLVIVTRATTRLQYAAEVERFTHARAFVCKPASDVRKRDKWKTLGEYLEWCVSENRRPVIVLGWESLPSWADRIEALKPFSLVLDESQKGKSKKRWEAVPMPMPDESLWASAKASIERRGGKVKESSDGSGQFVGLVPLKNIAQSASRLSNAADRRLATTATPISDRVRDLWGQLDLIEPWAWGSYRIWAFRYCDAKPGMYGGLDDRGASRINELATRLQCIKHFVSVDVARQGLPAKRRQTWYIPPSGQVKPSGGWQRAVKAAAKMGGSAMLEVRLSMAASCKRRAIVRRVAEHCESSHKIVVFTARRRDCEELAEAIGKLKKKEKPGLVLCGHGGHSQTDRRAMLMDYIAHPGPCVLVGTGEAWGTGVDGLQCTDAAIFALLPYTPGSLDQWEGRFTRHGQDRPVTVYYPIAEGTADEHLASILLEKLPAVADLTDIGGLDGAAEALAGEIEDEDEFAASILSSLWAAEGE